MQLNPSHKDFRHHETAKRVLITGGLGFIGSHTVVHYLHNTDWHIVVIDSLRHAGRVEPKIEFVDFHSSRPAT